MDSQQRVDLATQIFTEYGPVIRTLIRQYVADPEDEDEVYQNLYLSLVHRPPSQPVLNMPAYLNTVIRNDVIDALRRRRSQHARVAQYAMSRARDEVDATEPEEGVTRAEEVQRITDLVGRMLPAHEAEAVIERYIHGHSTMTAAQHMHVKERTVARYACVGLRRIRQAVLKHSL
ncbi:MAG: sigma-70 family RNA polymerase sigma factor [Planctomycetes bacterium]|jgi:RNA polymerase sigma factor (sigma-70 family)|nr:sigma-70 family RNA polymerase sigma factor [Planctomycetota bacterium]